MKSAEVIKGIRDDKVWDWLKDPIHSLAPGAGMHRYKVNVGAVKTIEDGCKKIVEMLDQAEDSDQRYDEEMAKLKEDLDAKEKALAEAETVIVAKNRDIMQLEEKIKILAEAMDSSLLFTEAIKALKRCKEIIDDEGYPVDDDRNPEVSGLSELIKKLEPGQQIPIQPEVVPVS